MQQYAPINCCWHRCSKQYKSVHCYQRHVITGYLCTVVKLQNSLYFNNTLTVIGIKYCVCLYSSLNHPSCKVHLFCTILNFSSVACLALPHFSTLPHKWHDFPNRITEHKKCFDILCNFYLTHFSFSGEFSEILSLMYVSLHENYPIYLSYINQTWIFLQISENPQI